MSKIKLTGHASGTGTLTLTGPNTSTDRTITLPDGTGTLIADDGSGNVGIGTSSPSYSLDVSGSATDFEGLRVLNTNSSNSTATTTTLLLGTTNSVRETYSKIQNVEGAVDANETDLVFSTTTSANVLTERLRLKSDGRGLSQFTAKVWGTWTGTSLATSHNISSATDAGTGQYTFNFSNNMANTTYSVVATSHKAGGGPSAANSAALSVGETRAVGSCLIESFRADLATREDKPVLMLIFGE